MTEEQQKFYNIKTTTDYEVTGDDIDYKVYVDDDKGEVVLLFEESDSRRDWINNLLFIPWPLRLNTGYKRFKTVWTTLGYARAYKSTKDKPLEEFLHASAQNPEYWRAIRGWSFGSAMAKITARHLEALGCHYNELTTFGDVKCWLNPFYKPYGNAHEYVTPNDFVTWQVPFFHRDATCKVGPRFSIKEIFKSEYYHTHYEEYDYSIWEEL